MLNRKITLVPLMAFFVIGITLLSQFWPYKPFPALAYHLGGGEDDYGAPAPTPAATTTTTASTGGGYRLMEGDLNIEITQQVSADGEHFVSAATPEQALGIPGLPHRLYYRVALKNLGDISVVNVQLGHSVDNETDPLNTSELTAEGADYDAGRNQFLIEKIQVGQTFTFNYHYRLFPEGVDSDHRVRDRVIITHYESRLPANQDALTYAGRGATANSYLSVGAPVSRPVASAFYQRPLEMSPAAPVRPRTPLIRITPPVNDFATHKAATLLGDQLIATGPATTFILALAFGILTSLILIFKPFRRSAVRIR